jgi:hypothetical protein
MRHRKDQNHNALVGTLERIGCSVFDTSQVGGGFPDLVVGRNGRTMLIELKKELWTPKDVRASQYFFANGWKGHYAIASTDDEVIRIVTEATCRG